MANKISVLIDVATDKAIGGLKGFKSSIMDADGAVGKMKAGASSAFDSIKGQAGNMAMAAGAALVTFGVKAVGAFQDAALGAGKFADATGLSTETASRWVAVADDIGISAETMEKSFGKLAVSVGKNNPLLEEYGITVKKGADGQDDMNATMLHAVDVIKSIQDPTKKAAVAQAALGKGWMDMAELIQQGSGSLTESMAAVSEAQVIDPEEVEKARKMRESLDNLQDSVRDVALVMGEDLVPMVAVLADVLVKVIGPISDLNQMSKDWALGMMDVIGLIDRQKAAIDPLIFGYGQLWHATDSAGESGEDYIEMARGMIDATTETAETTDEARKRHDEWHDSIMEVTDAYKALKGELSAEEAFLNAEAMWADLQQSAVDSYTAAAEGAEDAAAKALAHKQEVNAAKQEVVDLGDKYRDLPEEEITRIVALIDEGQLAEAERRFNILTRNREMNISIIARGGAGYSTLPNFAGGGTVPGAMGSPQLIVAHGGEEIFDPRGGGHASTNGNSWAEGTMVNVQPGGIVLQGSNLTGRDVVEALAQYVRINGPAPLRKLTGG